MAIIQRPINLAENMIKNWGGVVRNVSGTACQSLPKILPTEIKNPSGSISLAIKCVLIGVGALVAIGGAIGISKAIQNYNKKKNSLLKGENAQSIIDDFNCSMSNYVTAIAKGKMTKEIIADLLLHIDFINEMRKNEDTIIEISHTEINGIVSLMIQYSIDLAKNNSIKNKIFIQNLNKITDPVLKIEACLIFQKKIFDGKAEKYEKSSTAMQRGWEFGAKCVSVDASTHCTEGYVSAVEDAISILETDMASLKSNQTDAVLGGYAAEYWHSGTFNIHAVAAGSESRSWVDVDARIQSGSVDIDTNFGKQYSSKYYSTAEKTAKAQSEYSWQKEQPKYNGQDRLVPTDQLNEVGEFARREAIRNSTSRPQLAEGYQETADMAVDRVSDGEIESTPLSKGEDLQIAREIKKDEFSADKHGENLKNVIKDEYLMREAAKAGVTTATVSMAFQVLPEVTKVIAYLIKNKKIDIDQLKKSGKNVLSSGTEGFLRGSISSILLIKCRQGHLGAAFENIDATLLGTIVAIAIETIKNSFLVAGGKMTPKEMGSRFADGLFISGGYLLGAKLGGVINQKLGVQFPVVGYLIGSLIGSACSVVYKFSKKKFISLCIDSGFTGFGLVDEDYTPPQEIALDCVLNDVHQVRQCTYEKLDLSFLRRGVFSVKLVS